MAYPPYAGETVVGRAATQPGNLSNSLFGHTCVIITVQCMPGNIVHMQCIIVPGIHCIGTSAYICIAWQHLRFKKWSHIYVMRPAYIALGPAHICIGWQPLKFKKRSHTLLVIIGRRHSSPARKCLSLVYFVGRSSKYKINQQRAGEVISNLGILCGHWQEGPGTWALTAGGHSSTAALILLYLYLFLYSFIPSLFYSCCAKHFPS